MPFSKPQEVIAHLRLQSGTTVADFGAGSGVYALAIAKVVGPEGRVYAIDIQKELLARLAREASSLHLRNIEVIRGDLEQAHGSTLASSSVDFVFIANLLFQTSAKYTLVCEAKRILKSGGRIALVDWSGSFGGLGPQPDQVLASDEAKKVFAEAGFAFLHDFPAGDQHYGLMFGVASAPPKS